MVSSVPRIKPYPVKTSSEGHYFVVTPVADCSERHYFVFIPPLHVKQ